MTKILSKIALFLITIVVSLDCVNSYAKSVNLDKQITAIINNYLINHQKDELVTGVAVSIGYPDKPNANYYAGKVAKAKQSKRVSGTDLFQLGSITKSYTAVILLQLEKEGLLTINQTIGDWLPEYKKWKNIPIKNLLNMTSGIPGYVTIPELAQQITQDIHRQWSNKEIVDLAYAYPHSTTGFNYSDTNYLIAAMIIEKATKDSFENQINKRLIKKYALNNTLYSVKPYTKNLIQRLARAYYYGNPTGSLRTGQDVTDANMSMAGAAGAVISTTDNLVHWVRLLYTGRLLSAKQQSELSQIVSMKTGLPIQKTSEEDPHGFGLGVIQGFKPEIGNYWFYAGDTVGHRAIYLMNPRNSIIVAVTLNSSPFVDPTVKEHSADLLFSIYQAVAASENRP